MSKTGPQSMVMQRILQLKTRDYRPYEEAFVVWSFSGTWNKDHGRARELKRWTHAAHDLFGRCTFPIPDEFLIRLKQGGLARVVPSPHMIDIRGILHPQQWYHTTASSPHRHYHSLQNLSKPVRSVLFRGLIDVDIVSAHGSIWWHELGGKDSTASRAYLLDPEHTEYLLEDLMQTFDLKTPAEAKNKRSSLFNERAVVRGEEVRSGVPWFDELHDEILSVIRAHRTSGHELFTRYERRIIERLSAPDCGDVHHWIHDGALYRSVDETRIRQAAHPHRLQIRPL